MYAPANPLRSLQALAERTITVADLAPAPLWVIDPCQLAGEAAAALAAREFDLAGVDANPVTHYVTKANLERRPKEPVAALAEPILASDAVERTLPLADLIEILASRPFVFVLEADRIGSVVTPADLQAPAVTVMALSYLVAIEAGLAHLVVSTLGTQWMDGLPRSRKAAAQDLYRRKAQQNVAIGIEQCLYFTDWLTLTSKSVELRKALGFTSRRSFEDFTSAFIPLRNDLAHGGSLMDGATALEATSRFAKIRRFADAVWDLVESRNGRWAIYAASVIEDCDGSTLAGRGSRGGESTGFVITAWNPDSVSRPAEENRESNRRLEELLLSRGYGVREVVGRSNDGRWREESFLVTGADRRDIVALGWQFGQRAVFDLSVDELLVLRCPDGEIVARTQREGHEDGQSDVGTPCRTSSRRFS